MNNNIHFKENLLKFNLENKDIYRLITLLLFLITTEYSAVAQYVHPNQAGRKGGDTGAGVGNQVVTSTYYGNAGSLYGQGVIMSVNKDGTNATSFHDFDGYAGGDGSYPFYTTPHQGSDGKLYGTTFVGGSSNWGAVYDYNFSTCSENVIYNAGPVAGSVSGGAVYANINELSDGKIYYLNTYGGLYNYGALYSMNRDGSNVTKIHDFSYSTAGQFPNYTLAAQTQLLTINGVYVTSVYGYDGAYPYGFVVEGADGKIYGSTYAGGTFGGGTWWRCNKDGSSYEIIRTGESNYLATQTGTGSTIFAYGLSSPWGNVAQDQAGKIYLTGYYGGELNLGAIARMDPDGSNYQLLLSGSAANGTYPYRGTLIVDNKAYGTFRTNGSGSSIGVVYAMNLDGTNYQKIKTFESPYGDGTDPWAGLSYDGSYLYGTTLSNGGPGTVGTIFKIKPDGTGFQTIHRFNNAQSAVPTSCSGTGKTGLYAYYPSSERVTFANVKLNCAITCVDNPSPCTASTTAPTLTQNFISNVCSATTANLTTLNSGTNITWHTATPATAANRVANPSSVGAGTYYATNYDAANDCYSSSSSAAVTVTITICSSTITLNAGSYTLTTSIDTPKTGNVATQANPQGTSPFSYTPVSCSAGTPASATTQGGTITVNATTGAYTYTPASGFTGVDTFCIKMCDGNTPTNCKTVTYTVTVTPKNCDALGSIPQY